MTTGSTDNKTVKISIELPGGLTRKEIEQYRESLQQLGSAIETIKQSMEHKSQDSPSKLLPCPFCGSPARLYDDKKPLYYVRCEYAGCHATTTLWDRRPVAIWAWNRRDLASNKVDPDGSQCNWFDDETTYRHWKYEMDIVEYVMYRLGAMGYDGQECPTIDQLQRLVETLTH